VRHLKKGIDLFGELSPKDRKWATASLRASIPEGEANDDLAAFLREKRSKARRPVVFLSHSHIDKPFVRSLAARLRKRGIDVWLDEAEIRVGDALLETLRDSIRKVDFVLMVLSPSSVRSSWVRRELKVALSNRSRRRVNVLPLLKEKCPVPAALRDHTYADFTTPYRRTKNFAFLVENIMSKYGERQAHRSSG